MPLNENLPIIGITMGDPAGIGAEVIVKALADPEIRQLGRFVVFGMNEAITYAADMAELDIFWWRDQHEHLRPYEHHWSSSIMTATICLDECSGTSKLGGRSRGNFCTTPAMRSAPLFTPWSPDRSPEFPGNGCSPGIPIFVDQTVACHDDVRRR